AQQHEHRAVHDAEIENLVDCAVPSGQRESVDSQRDQAEVTHRSEGKQLEEIALYQRKARAVEHADNGQRDQEWRDLPCLSREESYVEAQHRVETKFAGD